MGGVKPLRPGERRGVGKRLAHRDEYAWYCGAPEWIPNRKIMGKKGVKKGGGEKIRIHRGRRGK